MGRWRLWGLAVAGLVAIAPVALANGPPLEPARNQACAKKRTDACGCHHYYGLRHCHPKLKTDRCERPVSYTRKAPEAWRATPDAAPAPRAPQSVQRKKAVEWVPVQAEATTHAAGEAL